MCAESILTCILGAFFLFVQIKLNSNYFLKKCARLKKRQQNHHQVRHFFAAQRIEVDFFDDEAAYLLLLSVLL